MMRATARAERFQSHRNWLKLYMKASSFLSPLTLVPPSSGLSTDPWRDLGVCFLSLEDGTIDRVFLEVTFLITWTSQTGDGDM